jgi:RNA polymerase sigma factor (sigma-70 family)
VAAKWQHFRPILGLGSEQSKPPPREGRADQALLVPSLESWRSVMHPGASQSHGPETLEQGLERDVCRLRSLAGRNALAERWQYLPQRVLGDLLRWRPGRFRGLQTADLDDLRQVGCVALLKASEAWDPARSVKFQTFTYHCIRARILSAGKPRPRHRFLRRLRMAIEPGQAWSDPFQHADLYAALGRLARADRELLEQRFGLAGVCHGRTLQDLGREHGLTGEAIRRRIAAALSEVSIHLTACQ